MRVRVWGEEGAVAVSVSGRYTPIWFFRPCVWRVCVYMCVCVPPGVWVSVRVFGECVYCVVLGNHVALLGISDSDLPVQSSFQSQ